MKIRTISAEGIDIGLRVPVTMHSCSSFSVNLLLQEHKGTFGSQSRTLPDLRLLPDMLGVTELKHFHATNHFL